MKFRVLIVAILLIGQSLFAFPALATTIPLAVRQAIAWVHCGNRQGSGVVINADKGYVLTNAHVLLNLDTMKPGTCEVGFITDNSLEPQLFYDAVPDKYVYEESRNRDFAILKLTQPQQPLELIAFPALKTDEFSKTSDPITVVGFPSSAGGIQHVTTGTIQGLEKGIIKTDAEISPGTSGGAGINGDNNLVGMATRILINEVSPGVEEVVDYELVDVRAILDWLDTFGPGIADQYFMHANPGRYYGPMTYVDAQKLECQLLARTPESSTVYCLSANKTRSVFPNDTTYHSWVGDFTSVSTVSAQDLAPYRLTSNITMKPGSLIKITTDPKVYLVTDRNGTIRALPSEQRARELFGDGWAGFVKDIPDTFFINYHVGDPLP